MRGIEHYHHHNLQIIMKQRKQNTSSSVEDDDCAAPFSAPHRRKKAPDHGNRVVSSKWRKRAILFIGSTLLFFLIGNKLNSPSPVSSQQQQMNLPTNDRLRAEPQLNPLNAANNNMSDLPTLYYSQLLTPREEKSTNYSIPLTGSFVLDKEYSLRKMHNEIGGIISFPYADLSTILPEEVTSSFNFFSGEQKQNMNKIFKSVLVDDKINKKGTKQHISKSQALLTRCGYKPSTQGGISTAPNQDRSFIANFFLDSQSVIVTTGGGHNIQAPSALLMGIYDGHGGQGHVISHFVALELPRVFTKLIHAKQLTPSVGSSQYDDHIGHILKETYLEVDRNEPVKGAAGCTASSLFYPGVGPKVYLANVGDSTMMIVKYTKSSKQSTIVHQNRKHKPHLSDEQLRIKAAGGEIMIPPSLQVPNAGKNNNVIQESSRLLVPSPNGNPFGGMALAMSRAIGDHDAKVVGLISEPEVDIWDLNHYHAQNKSTPEEINDSEWFAVAASDGMYDVISPEEVAKELGQSLYSHEGFLSPLEACEQLIRKATLLWMNMAGGYRDDVSLGVSRLEIS